MDALYGDLLLVRAAVEETQRIVRQNALNYQDLLDWFVRCTAPRDTTSEKKTERPQSALATPSSSSHTSASSSSSASASLTGGSSVVDAAYVDQILRSAKAVRTGKRVPRTTAATAVPSPKSRSSISRPHTSARIRGGVKTTLPSSSSSTAPSGPPSSSSATTKQQQPRKRLRLPESFRKATSTYRERCGVILRLLQQHDEAKATSGTDPAAQLRCTFVDHLTVKPDLQQPLSALEEDVVFEQLSGLLHGGAAAATASMGRSGDKRESKHWTANAAVRGMHEQYASNYLDRLDASSAHPPAPELTATCFHTSSLAYQDNKGGNGGVRVDAAQQESANDMAKRLHHRYVRLHRPEGDKRARQVLQAFERTRCQVAANLVNCDMARMCSRYLREKYGGRQAPDATHELEQLWDYRLALVMLRNSSREYPAFMARD
jgi:hypothetical protein